MTRSLRIAVALAAVVVAVDQLTKHAAVNALADGQPRHVIWTLQWNLSFNRGMAFSAGQGAGVWIGLVAVAVGAFVLIAVRRNAPAVLATAAGLVAGGAFGNVADRLFRGRGWMRGAVVDFIDLQWFPIFNVADMAVNIGAALYLLWAVREEVRARRQARVRPAAANEADEAR